MLAGASGAAFLFSAASLVWSDPRTTAEAAVAAPVALRTLRRVSLLSDIRFPV